MKKTLHPIAISLLVSVLLAACGGGGDSSGDPGINTGADAGRNAGVSAGVDAGKGSLPQTMIAAQVGCVACHSLSEGEVTVGPSLGGIGTRADAGYVRESMLEPDAALVEGFCADMMPNVWDRGLTEAQLDQLVDYLLALK